MKISNDFNLQIWEFVSGWLFENPLFFAAEVFPQSHIELSDGGALKVTLVYLQLTINNCLEVPFYTDPAL